MAYKLIDAAEARWRAVNASHPVALVRAGAVFYKAHCSNDPSTSHPRARRINRNGGRLKQRHQQVLTRSHVKAGTDLEH